VIFDFGAGGRAAFEQEFDVCIAGAGPAGITLARRLAGQGARVALMEAGGLEISLDSQECYEGEIVGQEYFPLDITRLRYFGGSSNHRAGWCRELPASDFAPRPGDPWSGWPITKADLDPYQAAADAILDLPPAADYPEFDVVQAADRFRGKHMRHSGPATRFGQKFRSEIVASERISLALGANLVDLRLDAAGAVAAAVFRSYEPGSPELAVRARLFALALGGLENPRALLNANSQRPAGLGNEHDLVGRFFCEHPHYVLGEVLLEAPLAEAISLIPSAALRAEEGVLNFALVVLPQRMEEPLLLHKEIIRSVPCALDFTERLAEEVLGRPLYCEGRGVGGYLRRRRERAAILADPRSELLIRSEQALNPASRVRLAAARDRFGLPRIALDWRLSAIDTRTMQVAAAAFGAHAAEQGIGRLRLADWLRAGEPQVPPFPEEETGGHHHLCTTRMADDPRRGVVDRNGRVHGIPNLYLAGSSTFATAGWVNPTYTIVQLALRLGDHLGREPGKS
jgi:choline dehydrogenase-like flavoprotein